jgi:hypothetical protein
MLAEAGKDEELLSQLASDIGEFSRRLPSNHPHDRDAGEPEEANAGTDG